MTVGVTGVTILDGNRFYVADPAGDAGRGEQGLYADDVRVLSRWRLTLDGRPADPLGGGIDDGDGGDGDLVATVYGRVLTPGVPGVAAVTSRRRLAISRAGLREALTLTNYSGVPVSVLVRYEFAADFVDLYEVKARADGEQAVFPSIGLPPPTASRRWLPELCGWVLSAATDGFAAGVQVTFDADAGGAEAGYLDGETYYRVWLPPGGEWRARTAVLLLGDRIGEPLSQPGAMLDVAAARAAEQLTEWRAGMPELATGWPALAATYRRAVADLGSLRTPAPDGSLVPAAGLPWFMTVFGRDTEVTCLQTMALGQQPARAALRALAALQSTVDDPERDAEPGKIVHEVRAGPVAKLTGRLPYYGSVDSTPLFIMLAVETWRWTGDDALVRELEPALRAALGWMEGPADLSGRGYLEYHRRAPGGLEVQTWKDSFNSMLFADGRRAESPIAGCEVQGYGYAARLGLAEVARTVWGDGALADRLQRDAADLRVRFHRDFWVDTPAGGHYALALDRDGTPVDSLTSNIGHLLWTGIATESTVDRTVAALLSPLLFSGWGVRTMSTADAGYHPIEYHDGTVWPHDTSLVCLGLARVGRHAEAGLLLRGLLGAAERLDWRLPEVLAGFDRADTGFPLVYPTTCSPQAWAAAAPVAALTAVLGLAPDRATGTLTARGAPPPDLDLTLSGVPALGRMWTVTAQAGSVTVTPG
jgi:glycogen debranching enzyme